MELTGKTIVITGVLVAWGSDWRSASVAKVPMWS